MSTAPAPKLTEAEYLALEAAATEKSEFVDGELLAMSGVSIAHDTIVGNLHLALGNALRGTPCRVHSSDVRVRIAETGLYAYPDLSIVCGAPELDGANPPSLLNPRVLVEVLSASTERWDRGAKLAHYRHRASVELIVLVDSRAREVERIARNPDGTWLLSDHVSGNVVIHGVPVAIDEIYEGVTLDG